MAKSNYAEHSFWCIKCGKQGIPLARNQGHQHGQFHRKKLYCLNCKEEVNHVECKNLEEVEAFHEAFEGGYFKNEAEEPVPTSRSSRIW